MKSFPFIVCLVIGVWVGYYLGIKKPAEPVQSETPSPKASTMELMESFQEENKTLRERVAELEGQLAAFEAKEAEGLNKQAKEKNDFIAHRLKTFAGLIDLTADQKQRIGEIEWEFHEFWRLVREGEQDPDDNPFTGDQREEEIAMLLSEDQKAIYEAHLEQKEIDTAAFTARIHLGKYPVTLILSDDQKSAILENLTAFYHPDSRGDVLERWKGTTDRPYNRSDQQLIWAAEEILDEEQMDAFKQTLEQRKKK